MTIQADDDLFGLRVSVVISTLNEARNLPSVLSRLPANVYEVIIVDGRSVDDTVAVARRLRPGARVVTQTRKGKGERDRLRVRGRDWRHRRHGRRGRLSRSGRDPAIRAGAR